MKPKLSSISKEWYPNNSLLFKNKGSSNDFNKKEVFGSLYKPGINNNRNVMDIESYQLRDYVVIEIISPKEVV